MVRLVFTLVLSLAVPVGNALVVRPSPINWFVALCGDAESKQATSVRLLDPQHPLPVAKESDLRQATSARGEQESHAALPARASLRPFRLAIDWPLLVQRIASSSLLRLEIRLQI